MDCFNPFRAFPSPCTRNNLRGCTLCNQLRQLVSIRMGRKMITPYFTPYGNRFFVAECPHSALETFLSSIERPQAFLWPDSP